MGFKFNNKNIKERRVKNAIDSLYKAISSLSEYENKARVLIDRETVIGEIQTLSDNGSGPLLPLDNDLTINWNTLNFNSTSETKFINKVYNDETSVYDNDFKDILELEEE